MHIKNPTPLPSSHQLGRLPGTVLYPGSGFEGLNSDQTGTTDSHVYLKENPNVEKSVACIFRILAKVPACIFKHAAHAGQEAHTVRTWRAHLAIVRAHAMAEFSTPPGLGILPGQQQFLALALPFRHSWNSSVLV